MSLKELHQLVKESYNLYKPEDFKIQKSYGEECPARLLEVLELLFGEEFKYTPIPDKSTHYRIQHKEKIDYEFDYIICDENSNKTSPDFYITTNQDYNYFIEDTGCRIKDSGNNAQAQRATKFIPKLNSNDKLFYILSDTDIYDFTKQRSTLEYPFKQWRTSNVSVIFQNPTTMKNYLALEPYTTYKTLINHHDEVAKCQWDIFTYDEDNNIIEFYLNREGSKYNLLKKNCGLNNDPNKGYLSLFFQSIYNISQKNKLELPKIKLYNIALIPSHITYKGSGNKLFRTLKHIIDLGFDIEFSFPAVEENFITLDINRFTGYEDTNPFKEEGSVSEKIVSMYHVSTLENNKNIVFENHARSENTKIKYNSTILDFPKDCKKCKCNINLNLTQSKNAEKPDIIIQDTEKNKIYIIEAELYSNITKGQAQIDGWSKNIYLHNFYKMECKFNEEMDIYLELYDRNNEFNGDFSHSKFKNVKYILNTKGIWYENTDHYEPLQFSF